MKNTMKKNQGGFTLVELLIVVIILGILAAIVIPQFNSAASESKESTIASNLATIRQSIELYQLQHNDSYPGATIVTQLTTATDVAGAAGTKFGPYIRNKFPKNPINDDATIVSAATMPGAATGASGWVYATSTGDFRANVPGTGPSGTNYFDL